jgi:hypothetical protein
MTGCRSNPADGEVAFTRKFSGPIGVADEAKNAVVKSQEEWRALWAAGGPGRVAPPVELDWSKSMLIAVALGSRPSGGFSVVIEKVTREGLAPVRDRPRDAPRAGQHANDHGHGPLRLRGIAALRGPRGLHGGVSATEHSTFAALAHRNFRLLWAGQFLSLVGTWMQSAAVLWHIATLVPQSDRALALGLVGLVKVVPIVVFALIGGVLADALDRRRLMFWMQCLMAGSAAAQAMITWQGLDSVWPIYALTALNSAAAAFEGPARQSLIPNLVPRATLSNAINLKHHGVPVGRGQRARDRRSLPLDPGTRGHLRHQRRELPRRDRRGPGPARPPPAAPWGDGGAQPRGRHGKACASCSARP